MCASATAREVRIKGASPMGTWVSQGGDARGPFVPGMRSKGGDIERIKQRDTQGTKEKDAEGVCDLPIHSRRAVGPKKPLYRFRGPRTAAKTLRKNILRSL